MNYNKEQEEFIQEYRDRRKETKKGRLLGQGGIVASLCAGVLEALIRRQAANQRENGQDKIKYLIFQRLLSSGYTGSYEISVGMSSAKLYLDEQITYAYWKPDLVFEDIEDAVREARQILSRKYVRIEEYELLHIKQQLLLDDWEVFAGMLKKGADRLAQGMIGSTLLLENEIQVVYGNYMDKLHIAYRTKTF